MSIPIIFIHSGDSEYLFYTFWQAKKTNPQSRVILLGDLKNSRYKQMLGIEHYPIAKYMDLARDGLRNYIHLSTNGDVFERFCIERWFILYEFLLANPETVPCVYLDSDILVYDSLDKPAQNLEKYGMTMVDYSAHTNFISNLDVLATFCRFISEHYENKSYIEWLHSHYENYIKEVGCGGISDMTFFHKFRQENPEQIGTLVEPSRFEENFQIYSFDEGFDHGGNYEMGNDGLKKLIWKDNIPYCFHLPSKQLVKFFTLHFHGSCKKLMTNYLLEMSFIVSLLSYLNRLEIFKNKIFNKIKIP